MFLKPANSNMEIGIKNSKMSPKKIQKCPLKYSCTVETGKLEKAQINNFYTVFQFKTFCFFLEKKNSGYFMYYQQ